MTDLIRHSVDELPTDSLPIGVIEIVSYLTSDGDSEFVVRVGGDMQLSHALGLIELSKDSIIRAYMDDEDSNVEFDGPNA